MIVWLITGKSESCDEMFPRIYSHKPTEEELKAIIDDLNEEEAETDGPGDFGSYWFLKTTKIEVTE